MTQAATIRVARLSTGFRLAMLVVFTLLVSLGVWQIQRLHWKTDLIARVDARVHAATTDVPGPEAWPQINAAQDEYRHIRVQGHFINDKTTYVQASTGLGMGYWVVTPLRTDKGFTVLVNRGFVPSPHMESTKTGLITLSGLLRLTEPGGRWLRHNIPAQERWYSRDTQAIAQARGLDGQTAPYFIDADASLDGSQWPAAGLTVIHFMNNHLQYALTWFGMALALGIGVVMAERQIRRQA